MELREELGGREDEGGWKMKTPKRGEQKRPGEGKRMNQNPWGLRMRLSKILFRKKKKKKGGSANKQATSSAATGHQREGGRKGEGRGKEDVEGRGGGGGMRGGGVRSGRVRRRW